MLFEKIDAIIKKNTYDNNRLFITGPLLLTEYKQIQQSLLGYRILRLPKAYHDCFATPSV